MEMTYHWTPLTRQSYNPVHPMVHSFGVFELNTGTDELGKSGLGVKLGGQPRQVLTLLVKRQGALVTRQEIKDALWNEATFTEFNHGVDTAIERICRKTRQLRE